MGQLKNHADENTADKRHNGVAYQGFKWSYHQDGQHQVDAYVHHFRAPEDQVLPAA